MRFLVTFLVLNIVLFSCGSTSSDTQVIQDETTDLTSNWVDVSSEDGRFKVKMPGTPTPSSTKEYTEVGDVSIEMFLYEESATVAFIVGYNDYPSALFEGADDILYNEMLMGGVQGFTENVGLDIIEFTENIKLGKAKGVAVKAKSSTNSFYVHYRAYIINNRLYQVGILRDGSYPANDKSDAFFGSFEIVQ